MFIRTVVAARVPASTPPGAPVVLKPIDPKSGVLIDPAKLGTPDANPWDPWILAYRPSEREYRSTDRPGHFPLTTVNKAGSRQMIAFDPIESQTVKAKSIALRGKSDGGLPVQFYVVSGPVELTDDKTLKLLPIAPSSKFPVRVIIGEYQWGWVVGDKVQTAGPAFQEFWLER